MAVSLVIGSPAIAADAPSIQLRPTGDASTGYFVLPAMPGQTVGQSVTVTNPSDQAVSAQLGPVDASTGVNGGSVFADSGVPPQGDGRWIHLSQTNLQLAPKANVAVPFTVFVPANAGPPGAHLAGITAWDPAASKASEGRGADGQARVKVTVTSRTVVGVDVRLPGGGGPHIDIQGVTSEALPQGAYAVVKVRNNGGDYARGSGELTVDGSFHAPLTFGTAIPNTDFQMPVLWTKTPSNGTHSASVVLNYNGGAARWSGEFQVGEELKQGLRNRVVGAARLPNNKGILSNPIMLIAGGIVLIAIIALVVFLDRRRRGLSATHPRQPAEARLAAPTPTGPQYPSQSTAPPIQPQYYPAQAAQSQYAAPPVQPQDPVQAAPPLPAQPPAPAQDQSQPQSSGQQGGKHSR